MTWSERVGMSYSQHLITSVHWTLHQLKNCAQQGYTGINYERIMVLLSQSSS